jgi:hypothetical protein
MPENPLFKSAILMVVLVVAALTSWELYLRNKGITPGYDDDGPLWSNKRAMVYEPADRATVFIGSSRIKFDLDIETWKNLTGDHAIQLAAVGSSPRPLLFNLADDENFKGKLIVDVTEELFFSTNPLSLLRPGKYIQNYQNRTPAQRVGFELDCVLDSRFVFLNKEHLSLNAVLGKLKIPDRRGVALQAVPCPLEFARVNFDRQNKMTARFLVDTNLHNQIINRGKGRIKPPPLSGAPLLAMLQSIKTATDKIKARGGQVFFVRTPSTKATLQDELKRFPRENCWNKMLQLTRCQGIHFLDYPALAHFTCPEYSHLTPADAILYTQALVKILHDDKGWKFPKLPG